MLLGELLEELPHVADTGGEEGLQQAEETLASAILSQVTDYANYPYAVGIGLVLLVLILVLIGLLTVLQQRTSGVHLSFRTG